MAGPMAWGMDPRGETQMTDCDAGYALQDALDSYVRAAIDYDASNSDYRDPSYRNKCQADVVDAIDALIMLRIKQIGQIKTVV